MSQKKYNLKKGVLLRFLRTFVPQMVIYAPLALNHAEEIKGFLPLWVVPAFAMVASMLTALDKFLRTIGFYKKALSVVKK